MVVLFPEGYIFNSYFLWILSYGLGLVFEIYQE